MTECAIKVGGISKAYKIYDHPRHRLLEAVYRGKRKFRRDFWALRDVTFQVDKGSTVGIMGMNGSGKSTLLQVIAGIVEPTVGELEVRGRIGSLLELGSGFNPEFTGRENIMMNSAIMGFSREETLARLPSIEAFAGIGDFIDQPVKMYSTGMLVRVAFAAAIHVDPDILLIDEALAVGDAIFQHRCIRRIKEFQEQGKSILFVSHDTGSVKSICSQAVLLHEGRVRAFGEADEVANLYHSDIANLEAKQEELEPGFPAPRATDGPALFQADPDFDQRTGLFRHGTGAARIRNVELFDSGFRPISSVEFNGEVTMRFHVEFYEDTPSCILGYFMRDRNGIDILGTNTYEEDVRVPSRRAGETFVVDFRQRIPLIAGTYSVTTGLAYNRYSPTYFDWIDNAAIVEVHPPRGGKMIHSKVWLPVEITIHT